MDSPLPPSTPLLLVKPPVGLATPAVFRALDLNARSTADPQQLLAGASPVLPMIPRAQSPAELTSILHASTRDL